MKKEWSREACRGRRSKGVTGGVGVDIGTAVSVGVDVNVRDGASEALVPPPLSYDRRMRKRV